MPPPTDPHASKSQLDSASRDALHARLRFYRDLGIGEFYRREVDPAVWAQPEVEPIPTSRPESAPSAPSAPPAQTCLAAAPQFPQPNIPQDQETAIAPRKPFPAAPAQAPPVPPEQ